MYTIGYVYSLAITLAFDPLTIVTIPFAVSPYSVPMPIPLPPFSYICLAICAFKGTRSLPFVKIVPSFVNPWASHFSPSDFWPFIELTLKAALLGNEHPQSLSLSFDSFTKINFVLWILDIESIWFHKLVNSNFLLVRSIFLNELNEIILARYWRQLMAYEGLLASLHCL